MVKNPQIFHQTLNQHFLSSTLAVPDVNGYEFIRTEDIIRLEGWQKYTRVHLADGRCLVSSYHLGTYKDQMQEAPFFHCHKSHVVSLQHIKRYQREGVLIMKNGDVVPVSRRKREEFMSQFVK